MFVIVREESLHSRAQRAAYARPSELPHSVSEPQDQYQHSPTTHTSSYVHKHPIDPSTSLLTLLPTEPPNQKLAIGTCTSVPPTPQNFTPNPSLLQILSSRLPTPCHLQPKK
ncbi:hypothetical protein SNOG_05497 [Parastagonospora nodorum SN15]|uniref:Uncharacterized protein n=1 Tax=Phaeosphaeria nodorum (strain SN15 / ATCC MYA-4574 / FGSC 10173) TaxID=321614 RepID=Q0URW7_PHANO|nr:hypothetical protein SNOG_05497 [Parastagonospora nodorum SN15]EAT86561.1 hypothetical protein SNOG_05497 [Parastagonospora nodorum SN15]